MAFKMVAVDMDWTILDLEKRIPMEVFEGFKGSLRPGLRDHYHRTGDGERFRGVFGERLSIGERWVSSRTRSRQQTFLFARRGIRSRRSVDVNVEKWWAESRPLAKEIMDAIVPKLGGIEYERVSDDGLLFTSLEDAVAVQEPQPLGCVRHYKYGNYDSQAEACGYQFSHFAEVC